MTPRQLPGTWYIASALIFLLAGAAALIPHRVEIIPERSVFATFPLRLGNWVGHDNRLEQIYIDALKFDDYLLADYTDPENRRVNLYVAYYGSQKSGESAHSPRSCLPGGGWQISNLTQEPIDGIVINNQPLQVNRVLIKKGDNAQLVYYWFQQRGRIITNEYLVKWYLFWDSLTRNRSDGALVRLTALIDKNRSIEEADATMKKFIETLAQSLNSYIPS
jgi:EpsI family protein